MISPFRTCLPDQHELIVLNFPNVAKGKAEMIDAVGFSSRILESKCLQLRYTGVGFYIED